MTTKRAAAGAAKQTPRPLRADAQRNRRRILAAAREVFARRGLDAGLDEIARHAGVGTGTVYRRFPDKRDLITALFEDRIDQVATLAHAAAEHPDPWLALAGLLESVIEMQVEDRGLRDILFRNISDETLRRRRADIEPALERVLERAKSAGTLRPDVEPTDLAAFQIMITHFAAFTEPTHPGLWRRHLALLLDGLRATRSIPTPLPAPPMSLDDFEAACGRGDHRPA